jgi:hypothetical protein
MSKHMSKHHSLAVDVLNEGVTAAILAAEEASLVAAVAWEEVAQYEHSLAKHSDVSNAERAIAERGAKNAETKARALRIMARAS